MPQDPSEWRGVPHDVKKHAPCAFRCIGVPCLAEQRKHPAGSVELALRSVPGPHRQSNHQWQHLCESCADNGEHQRWAPEAASARAAASGASADVELDDASLNAFVDVRDTSKGPRQSRSARYAERLCRGPHLRILGFRPSAASGLRERAFCNTILLSRIWYGRHVASSVMLMVLLQKF